MTEQWNEEEVRAINEIVDKATEAFGSYNMIIIGQALSALLGLYFHRLGTDERRLEIGKVLMDAATRTCRGLEEEDKHTIN